MNNEPAPPIETPATPGVGEFTERDIACDSMLVQMSAFLDASLTAIYGRPVAYVLAVSSPPNDSGQNTCLHIHSNMAPEGVKYLAATVATRYEKGIDLAAPTANGKPT